MILRTLFLMSVVSLAAVAVSTAQDSPTNSSSKTSSRRRQPTPPVRYELSENSKRQDGVPQGRLEGPFLLHSKIIENTVRKYWISIPTQYDPEKAACVLVFQDGARAINPEGVLRVPQVLDNLIAKHLIPVTIGIYITPGQRGNDFPDSIGTGNPDNRDREYDVLDDRYARMVIDEILPEVGRKYRLTNDPAGRAIGGASSGAICAFTVAWHRPDQFRNVISLIGSFTNIHGGHIYPQLVRDSPPKPIRVFVQDGIHDNRNPSDPHRDWYLQNQAMVAALQEKKYDFVHVFGEGGHSDDHGGAMLPEILQWIWRDRPEVQSVPAEQLVDAARQLQPLTIDPFPGFDAQSMINPVGQWKSVANNRRGRRTEVLTIEGNKSQLRGKLETTSVFNDETTKSTVEVDRIEMTGNKLTFDVQREFRGGKFNQTIQGIVTENAITGWLMSELNGQPQDTPWRANRENP